MSSASTTSSTNSRAREAAGSAHGEPERQSQAKRNGRKRKGMGNGPPTLSKRNGVHSLCGICLITGPLTRSGAHAFACGRCNTA